MSQAVQWIKSNPVMLVAVIVAMAAVGFIAFVLFIGGSSISTVISDQEKLIKQIAGLQRQSITLPPNLPGGRPETVSGITINPKDVRALQKINDTKAEELRRTIDEAEARQQVRRSGDNPHRLFYRGLFQQDKIPAQFSTLDKNDLRDRYAGAFRSWLKDAAEGAAGPRLNAGTPPSPQALAAEVESAREAFFERFGAGIMGGAAVQLSPEQLAQAVQELPNAWKLAVKGRAESIDMYVGGVSPQPADAVDRPSRDRGMGGEFGGAFGGPRDAAAPAPTGGDRLPMPFDVRPIDPNARVHPSQVWERQMELWVQQDVARVIERVNRPAVPGTDVTTNPIKQLVRVEVQPGYVGLHTAGAVDGQGQVLRDGRAAAEGSVETPAYGPPAAATFDVDKERMLGNYNVAFTGRVSNPLFDVRHVYVKMLVDLNQLPRLWDAIQRVGFQTVVDFELTDVDEYAALQAGYYYGVDVDVWELELVIESLWLREALAEWMPPSVKDYLGMQEAVAADAAGGVGPAGDSPPPTTPGRRRPIEP